MLLTIYWFAEYPKALKSHDIEPIESPWIEFGKLGNQDSEITITAAAYPEAEIKEQHKGKLELKRLVTKSPMNSLV